MSSNHPLQISSHTLDEFTNYERHPIQLSEHCIMVIELFEKKYDRDFWKLDHADYQRDSYEKFEKSAEQMIKQFEGHCCGKFIMELKKQCNKYLQDHDNKYGTHWYEENKDK